MRLGAIIQARMSSARLPGKVLMPLLGVPVLERVVRRVRLANELDVVVVATSTETSDDAVAAKCEAMRVCCVRGDLDDVASRMLKAAHALRLDAFVRVCADSPLIDPALVGEAADRIRVLDGVDVVTNVLPRTYPRGQSVEAIRTQALLKALESMDDDSEREHVTRHFYRRRGSFRVERMISPMEGTDVSMALDEAEDVARLEALLAHVGRAGEDMGWMALAQHLRKLDRSIDVAPIAASACCAPA